MVSVRTGTPAGTRTGRTPPVSLPSTVVLSELEFDVLWESQRFPRRHVVLDVPSPGATRAERDRLVKQVWAGLAERGLAHGERPVAELADQLALLAYPRRSVDAWIWTDRPIRALSAAGNGEAVLAVVDTGEVWLIPARDSAFVPAAVSVAGDVPAGPGVSVSTPLAGLREADLAAGGDPAGLVTELRERGVNLNRAHNLAQMLGGMRVRGQFGAEVTLRDQRVVRANRVVAFHDTPRGRYLYLVRPSADGHDWVTVTPANNSVLAGSVLEMFDELG
jgi:hypothetical protein